MRPYPIQRRGKRYRAMEIPPQYLEAGTRRTVVMALTLEEVRKRWHTRVVACLRGLDGRGGQLTVGRFLLKEFMPQCEHCGTLEPSTLEDYRYHIRQHINPLLGRKRLSELSVRDVDQFVQTLRQKKSPRTGRLLGARTVQYAHGVLRNGLQLAVDYNYIANNPAAQLARRSRVRVRPAASKAQFFTVKQAQAFLQEVAGDRNEALYVLGLTTGLRKGELLGLTWSDIDFTRARLTVNHSVQFTRRRKGAPGPRWKLKGPKTVLSRRTIDVPRMALAALACQRERQAEMREWAGPEWQELGLVFTSRCGTPIDTANALHDFHAICRHAGLPEIRFYDLRHTHASLLIHEGVHAKKIAERLGHSSIKLTMDTYGHLFEGCDGESAERMDRLFGDSGEAPKRRGAGKIVVLPCQQKLLTHDRRTR